ncbi:MAG: helix-turn-helix domain-containing protein [Cytophagales bacterium]|nr:helix-turn-helix domain-containing protein [Cytophagales bacterium]
MHKKDMEKVNITIKELRKKKGITQKSMAERLFMSRSTFSKIESGNTNLYYDTLASISKILDIPISEIIKENEDQVFKSRENDLSLMLYQTNYWLSEKLYKIVPFNELSIKQKKLLKEKGFDTKEKYENTLLGGRLYKFGPKDVFRHMVENYGMDVLFKRKMLFDRYWNLKWEKYLKDKEKWNALLEENDFESLFDNERFDENGDWEIDEREYFSVCYILLSMPENKQKLVQFARRDFPNGADESEVSEYLMMKTGALFVEFLSEGFEGYDPVNEIIK